MDNKEIITLQEYIDKINTKNSLGYFIKIFGTIYKGSFLNRSSENFSFFIESLNEVPYKYIHYNITDIDIIQPTKHEINTLKKHYQNINKIPCVLLIKIESKEE